MLATLQRLLEFLSNEFCQLRVVHGWRFCVLPFNSYMLMAPRTWDVRALNVQAPSQKSKGFLVDAAVRTRVDDGLGKPNLQQESPKRQPSHLWKLRLFKKGKSIASPSKPFDRQASGGECVSKQSLGLSSVEPKRLRVRSGGRVLSRREGGANRLTDYALEAFLMQHLEDPFNQLDIGQIIVPAARQINRGADDQPLMCHGLWQHAGSSTYLHTVKVEAKRFRRPLKILSNGLVININTKSPQLLSGGVVKEGVGPFSVTSQPCNLSNGLIHTFGGHSAFVVGGTCGKNLFAVGDRDICDCSKSKHARKHKFVPGSPCQGENFTGILWEPWPKREDFWKYAAASSSVHEDGNPIPSNPRCQSSRQKGKCSSFERKRYHWDPFRTGGSNCHNTCCPGFVIGESLCIAHCLFWRSKNSWSLVGLLCEIKALYCNGFLAFLATFFTRNCKIVIND